MLFTLMTQVLSMINKSFDIVQYDFLACIRTSSLHHDIFELNIPRMPDIGAPRRRYTEEKLFRIACDIFGHHAFSIFLSAATGIGDLSNRFISISSG